MFCITWAIYLCVCLEFGLNEVAGLGTVQYTSNGDGGWTNRLTNDYILRKISDFVPKTSWLDSSVVVS
jgi:hypothetical protein